MPNLMGFAEVAAAPADDDVVVAQPAPVVASAPKPLVERAQPHALLSSSLLFRMKIVDLQPRTRLCESQTQRSSMIRPFAVAHRDPLLCNQAIAVS